MQPAMGTNLANEDGTANEAITEYYAARARGGYGLITLECTAVSENGTSLKYECGMWNDKQSESFKMLTNAVHEGGAKICLQLVHHGRQGSSAYIGGKQIIAPSAVPCPLMQEVPRELSTEEVYEEIENYVNAAVRAKNAGFDAVELHVASGYLIEQFLSLHSNKRVDEFGGTLENRMRFLKLIIRGIRLRLGNDFPIIIRVAVEEYMVGGISISESKAICRVAESEGVDAIDVTVGTYGSIYHIIGCSYLEPGYQHEYSRQIKEIVNIPVMGVGRLQDPYIAQEALLSGEMDLVCVGRQAMADPEYVNKILAKKIEDIAPCISCNQGCIHQLFADTHVSCVVNPFNGNETTKILTHAEKSKKVMVIGGGPAGLLAAWLLAKRGHKVSLVEKSDKLGGAFLVAAYPPGKSDITKMLAYYIHQCKKYGVEILMNTEANKELISEFAPDTIVLATGSKPLLPHIEGIDNEKFMLANDVLFSKAVPGHNVLVAGGGLIGAETADFLAEQTREVTIIEMKSSIAADLPAHNRPVLMSLLKKHEVNMITDAVIKKFNDDGVSYEKAGELKELSGYDTVVLAMGTIPNNPLEEIAKECCDEIYVIGDAKNAGNVFNATHDAMDVALSI